MLNNILNVLMLSKYHSTCLENQSICICLKWASVAIDLNSGIGTSHMRTPQECVALKKIPVADKHFK